METKNHLGADRTKRGRIADDRGNTMLVAAILIIFLMSACWALVSGSEQWGARRDAQAVAAAAARAGAQVTAAEVRGGVTIDEGAAQQRASAVLAASGYTGVATVDGLTVTVVASRGVTYTFPAPGFPGSVTARATSNAVSGVSTAGG